MWGPIPSRGFGTVEIVYQEPRLDQRGEIPPKKVLIPFTGSKFDVNYDFAIKHDLAQ